MQNQEQYLSEQFDRLPIEVKEALFEIVKEYEVAVVKHPNWPQDLIHCASIVGEEAGELLQASLQHIYEEGSFGAIEKEVIQTGAVSLRLLINLKGGGQ